jgi:hypothetical protein
MTLLLAWCLMGLDSAFPCCGTIGPGPPEPAVLARMVQGRLLLCLVRKGMTEAQVERILGRPQGKGWNPDLSGYEADYPYGVVVDYRFPGRQVIGTAVSRLELTPRHVDPAR